MTPSLVILFNHYLLSTYYVPDIELGARDSIDWVSVLIKFIGGGQTRNRHMQLLQSVTNVRKEMNNELRSATMGGGEFTLAREVVRPNLSFKKSLWLLCGVDWTFFSQISEHFLLASAQVRHSGYRDEEFTVHSLKKFITYFFLLK